MRNLLLSPAGVRFEVPDPVPTPSELAASLPGPPGLYVHIPLCTTLCPFCPYNKVRYDDSTASSYLSRLRFELDLWRDAVPGPYPSLYVGGGTPTLVLDELPGIVGDLPVTGERAIEVLPTHLTGDGARRIAAAGFDFVSVGIQSFDDRVLHRLGRPTSAADNRAALDNAVGRFACVDVDLIFDAAYDDPSVLLADLRACFTAGVDQVSTYPLMRFGFTPFGKGRHDREAEHRLLGEVTELAGRHGYERRAVWTFNRRGAPAYTSITREFYVGVGAGAATYTGQEFVVNHFGLEQYAAALDRGTLPVARRAPMTPGAAAAYWLFWQLYTGRVPRGLLRRRFGSQPHLELLLLLAVAAGWLRVDRDALSLTPSGYDRYHDLERWVTYHLIEPLWTELTAEHGPQTRRAPSLPSPEPAAGDGPGQTQ